MGVLPALLLSCFNLLAWCLLRLERPEWQRIIQNRSYWFPQTDSNQPRQADPLRYLIQMLYLLLVREHPARWLHGTQQTIRKIKRQCGTWLGQGKQKLQNTSAEAIKKRPVRSGKSWWLKRSKWQQRLKCHAAA